MYVALNKVTRRCKLVHGCIVYAKHAPRWQLFHVAPSMQQPNNIVTTLVDIQNTLCKATVIQICIQLERSGSAQKLSIATQVLL